MAKLYFIKKNGDYLKLKNGKIAELFTNDFVIKAANKVRIESPLVEVIDGQIKADLNITSLENIIGVSGVYSAPVIAPAFAAASGPGVVTGGLSVTGGNVETDSEVKDSKGTMDDMRIVYNGHNHGNNGADAPGAQM